MEDYFIIEPEHSWWKIDGLPRGKDIPDGYEYRSDSNTCWLTGEELLELLKNPSAPRKI